MFLKRVFGLVSLALVATAITEDENAISMRDANSSRERPRLDKYDFDDDDFAVI
jgi:hypothetical protein